MELDEDRIRERAYELWIEAGRPERRSEHFWFAAKREAMADEASYDSAVEGSFPASDPPGNSGITGPAAVPEVLETTSTRVTGNEAPADPGGTRPTRSANANEAVPVTQTVRSGDRNDM